jgi:hypothetical protein
LVLLILALGGCSSRGFDQSSGTMQWLGLKNQHTLERSSNWLVSGDARLYVAQPPDNRFDPALHQQLVLQFSRYYPHTQAGGQAEDLTAAFASARLAGMEMLVYPAINQRQGRHGVLAVLNNKAPKLQRGKFDLDLWLYNVSAEQKVDHIQFRSRAGMFTANEEGLLWQPLDHYLRVISQY